MTAIIRRSPARALTLMEPMNILGEVEMFLKGMRDAGFSTSLDMFEHKDELVIKAELPGIKKKDLDINLERDEITIKAEKKREEVTEDATYYRCERHFGQYQRSILLPFHVDAEKASAIFKGGLLEIKLPKAEEAKSRHIEVKAR